MNATHIPRVNPIPAPFLSDKAFRIYCPKSSVPINAPIITMNKAKLLTINSQPRVNGAKSTDPSYGWGPEKGYVYQKAYYELFVHQNVIKQFAEHLGKHENITW